MTITRFPPSPTGYLHIGGARTALYSWLHARQNKGVFILRIEDTDLERSTQESVQAILDGMEWLGLDYDQGPYYQTERFDRYKEVVSDLLNSNDAYHCECSKERLNEIREKQKESGLKPKYDGRCRDLNLSGNDKTVVRFKNPLEGNVTIDDLVKGNIVISNHELDDLVIARPDGVPTYNLTVVVDDMDMKVSHVIRGDDHINNTPRQINILNALGAQLPFYAHVPMILGADGSRMSKRHSAVSVMQYRDDGFLPEALLCYLVRLGWSHGDQEIFTIEEMLTKFDIKNVSRSASTFDYDKLMWVNQEIMKEMSSEQLLARARWYFEQEQIIVDDFQNSQDIVQLVRERCKTLIEIVEQSRFFFSEPEIFDDKALKKHIKTGTLEIINSLIESLDKLEVWTLENIKELLESVVKKHDVGFGKVAQPVRIAVTGSANSPSIDATLAILGKEKSIDRLKKSLEIFAQEISDRN